jgi:hypothetical protein
MCFSSGNGWMDITSCFVLPRDCNCLACGRSNPSSNLGIYSARPYFIRLLLALILFSFRLKKSHTGRYLAEVVKACLVRFGIDGRVSTPTSVLDHSTY